MIKNIHINKKYACASFLFLCCFFSVQKIEAQTPKIQWVKQFPSLKSSETGQSLTKKIFNFITGKPKETLIRPFAVYAKDSNNWLVLDQGKMSLLAVDLKKNRIHTIKEDFPSLVSICSNSRGRFFFTDSKLNKIFTFQEGSSKVSVFQNSLNLHQPTGIACSPITQDIWVAETKLHRISVLNSDGSIRMIIGKRGTGPGEFNFPTYLWIGNEGNVYVVDSMNFRIQILDGNGKVLSVFGEAGDASGYLSRPKGIATDSKGHIFVVDALFHTVQIFDRAGNFLFNFGEQGNQRFRFWMPTGIYIDNNDIIYIADSYNSRIQVFRLVEGENGENR